MKAKERGYTIITIGVKQGKKSRSTIIFMVFEAGYWDCLKRNLNVSKPCEHPSSRHLINTRVISLSMIVA